MPQLRFPRWKHDPKEHVELTCLPELLVSKAQRNETVEGVTTVGVALNAPKHPCSASVLPRAGFVTRFLQMGSAIVVDAEIRTLHCYSFSATFSLRGDCLPRATLSYGRCTTCRLVLRGL